MSPNEGIAVDLAEPLIPAGLTDSCSSGWSTARASEPAPTTPTTAACRPLPLKWIPSKELKKPRPATRMTNDNLLDSSWYDQRINLTPGTPHNDAELYAAEQAEPHAGYSFDKPRRDAMLGEE